MRVLKKMEVDGIRGEEEGQKDVVVM